MNSITFNIALLFGVLFGGDKSQDVTAIKKELGDFTSLVGKWKGTATPQDSAAKRKREFWRETGDCQWSFAKDKTGLILDLKSSKQIQSAMLQRSSDKSKPILLKLVLADKREPILLGKISDNKLVAEGKLDDGAEFKLTMKLVNPNRFTYSLASRKTSKDRFESVVESAHQREGVAFASKTSSGPECIVTGGYATIPVSYKGKTYYVCCNGCKEAFEAEPEKYIAEAAAKRNSKKK